MYIKFLNEINKDNLSEVGGKGASLGEMINIGLPVPNGFVITTQAFKDFSGKEMSKEFEREVSEAFKKLNAKRVAVRSSAVAEDSINASWAGQLDSFLNTTQKDLFINIQKCWDSIRSERAQIYTSDKKLSKNQMKVAVVVQKMVDSEVSGVMFTANPVSGNKEEIMIEAGWGLGEMIVQGMITPDNYIINKGSLEIVSKEINSQEKMLIYKDNRNQEVEVPLEMQSQQKLTEGQIIELAKLAVSIENHFGYPQDIEWAIAKEQMFILQSRPVTTLRGS